MRKNAEFQSKAGLRPRIIRKAVGKCCDWCQALAGKYDYPDDVPRDVYRRHANCNCTVEYDPGVGKRVQDVWSKRWTRAEESGKIERRKEVGTEMSRRRIAEDGHEIIDRPMYNKLTRDFLRRGGIIIRGEEARRHLEQHRASAAYIAGGGAAFIRDDATVSDVLEEMYHAEQDRKHMFGEIVDERVILLREIDAKKYLLSMADKYKIPSEELQETRETLQFYEEMLKDK